MRRALLCLLPAVGLGATFAQADELPVFDRLWDYAKPAETEARFRALLEQAEASGNLDYHLQLLTQIARTLGMQEKFDEAHALLDEVETKLTKEVPVARVRYLLERGRTFLSSEVKDAKAKARALFLEAWDLAKASKADMFAIDAAHMMGIVEPPEKQLPWSQKAMEVAEASENPRAKGWLGALYNNIGWSLFELGRFEEALVVHEKGLAWRVERGQTKPLLIARWAVARMKRALERYEEALKTQQELIEAWKEVGEENGFVHEEMAENLLALGRADEARPHFVKAWALLKDKDWLKSDEPERYARLKKRAGAAN